MTNLLIADVAPTGAQWNGFLSVAMWASIIGMNLVTIWALTRRSQKREVHFGFEPASKVEFQHLVERNEREHENLFSKIGGVERGQAAKLDVKFAELSKDAHEGRDKLHTRINDVLKAVSRLEGKIQGRSNDD